VEIVQKYLDENQQLILAILENQNLEKLKNVLYIKQDYSRTSFS